MTTLCLQCFKEFVDEMRGNGTWGNELCLKAAAESFRTNVHVGVSLRSRIRCLPELLKSGFLCGTPVSILSEYTACPNS